MIGVSEWVIVLIAIILLVRPKDMPIIMEKFGKIVGKLQRFSQKNILNSVEQHVDVNGDKANIDNNQTSHRAPEKAKINPLKD